MSDIYPTIVNVASEMVHLSGAGALKANVLSAASERTADQANAAASGFGLPGMASQGLAGFFRGLAGTYEIYRKIGSHPTVALVMGIVKAPVIGNSWKWLKRDSSISDGWVDFVRGVIEPLRSAMVRDCLKALEYGWAPFEMIWSARDGRMVLQKLKPLKCDYTEILVDEFGRVGGIENTPPGRARVELREGKYFVYTHDGEAGDAYGRSRHENIRKEWSEAEQVREKLAQYMRKIAGIVAQLHYPEGTSKDAAGADRPNQWLAQQVLDAVSQGKSVMFPNGFADTTDPRMAYELAGKSQWVLSSFDPGGPDHAAGIKTVLEYYDALLFRGWLRPERVGLEAQHGSRADAQAHTDTGTLDCELIDRDLARAINAGIVDPLLAMNFGTAARGAVYAEPAPIEDDSIETYKTLLNALLADQNAGPDVARKIDVDALLESVNVPTHAASRGAIASDTSISG